MADVQLLAKRAQKLTKTKGRSLPPVIDERVVNNTQTISEDSIIEKVLAKLKLEENRSQRFANNPNRDRKYRSKKDDECRKCGKKGHWARECRSKETKDDKNKASKFCEFCKKTNHTIDKCWSRQRKEKTIANILGKREERRIRVETSENDKNQQPQIEVLVIDPETNDSKAVKALADSGSSLTCASSKFDFFKDKITRSVVKPVAANGARIKVAGQCVINMRIGGTLLENITVVLIDDLNYDMILGNNLLLAVGFKIHKGGKQIDIGQEKNLPVYGVNQLRENEQCINTTHGDCSFSLNSMMKTNQSLSDTCPKNIGHIRRIPQKSSTSYSDLINGISCCDTREKQELRGISATEISEKQNEKASQVEKYIQLRENQTDVIGEKWKRLQEFIVENKDVFSKSEYDIGKFVDDNGKSDPIKIEIKNVNVQEIVWLEWKMLDISQLSTYDMDFSS